jgi:hypothetical protein
MSNVRVPGVAWAIGIIVLIALIHSNATFIETNWHVEPWQIDLAISVLVAGLKTLNLGTEQLNQALDVIDQLLSWHAQTAMAAEREAQIPSTAPVPSPAPAPRSVVPVQLEKIPERPNKAVRWLFG